MSTLAELKARYRRQVEGDGGSDPALPLSAVVASRGSGGFPLVLRFPGDAPMAFITGQFQRLADGTIEATFNDEEELFLCFAAVGVDIRRHHL